MIKNIEELQQLITWARGQKLKSLKLDTIEFEFSELAHVDGYQDMSMEQPEANLSTPATSPKLPDGQATLSEDEELLYWSTR